MVCCHFGTCFNLICFMSYSSSFGILLKLFSDNLPLVCFWFLLYSVIYLFYCLYLVRHFWIVLVVDSSLLDIELISLFLSEWVLTVSGGYNCWNNHYIPCTFAQDMGNNIFWNFSWGNNIPKIFLFFICLCVFGVEVCMYVCHYFYFIVLGSCIPKPINYLGVRVCDCV